ncbi:MAG TPA: leucine-rich repeat domain-containing protein [Burkholderiales bacterium]|nr:leucine-rich repeat domain-containing protein [Burkholderiales bacterium]
MKLQLDNLLKKRDSLCNDDKEMYLLPKFKRKIEIILTNCKKNDDDSLTQKFNTIIYAINYCQDKISKNNKNIDKILLNKLIEDFSDILQSNSNKIKYFNNSDDSLVANELKKHAKKTYEPLKMAQDLDKWIEENTTNKKNCIKVKNKILEAYEKETTYLCLARLCLKSIPPGINKLNSLRRLDLSHNQITRIEEKDIFYRLTNLKKLNLSYNRFEKISLKALGGINNKCQITPSRIKLKFLSINQEEKVIHDEIARELINIRNNFINNYFKNDDYMISEQEWIEDYNNYINNNYIELDNKRLNLRNEITWENILDINEDTIDKIENTKFVLLKRGGDIYDIYDLPALNQWLIKNNKNNLFTKQKVKADEIIGGQELLDMLQNNNS